jgi:6-phosphofructokinase 2
MAVESSSIASVTLSPALDEAIAIDELLLGETNRCSLDGLDPGGKGINASRVIHRLGRKTVAYGFLGGSTGQLLRERLQAEGLALDFDEVAQPTRLNIMVYERDRLRRTRLYLPGACVLPAQAATLHERLMKLEPGSLVIFGGSVPPGLPETIYHEFVLALRERGILSIVDTSGAALKAVLAAKPLLIKPDVEEAEALLNRRLLDDAAVLSAAEEIRRLGPEHVVISQGAEGAIGVGPDGAWKLIPPAITASSTVGSGDSMVAGLAVALNEGSGFVEGLRLGTATGAATAMVSGTQLCDPQAVLRLLPDVVVRTLNPVETRM